MNLYDRQDLCVAWAIIDALKILGYYPDQQTILQILRDRARVMDGLYMIEDLQFIRSYLSHFASIYTTTYKTVQQAIRSTPPTHALLCRIYEKRRTHLMSIHHLEGPWYHRKVVGMNQQCPTLWSIRPFNRFYRKLAEETGYNTYIIAPK